MDQCANANFITKSLVQELKLEIKDISATYSGLSDKTAVAKGQVEINLGNRHDTKNLEVTAYVVDEILNKSPGRNIQRISQFDKLKLANPNYHIPANIQILLGARLSLQ